MLGAGSRMAIAAMAGSCKPTLKDGRWLRAMCRSGGRSARSIDVRRGPASARMPARINSWRFRAAASSHFNPLGPAAVRARPAEETATVPQSDCRSLLWPHELDIVWKRR
jgi:hypothetical protein